MGSLLERVTVERELEQAQADRRYGERLRSSWVAALDVLHHLVGFRFSFCPDTYPAWAIPEGLHGDGEPWQGQAPHGALEQLLKGRLTVGWPAPVLEAATSSKAAASSQSLVAQVRHPRKLASAPGSPRTTSGTQLKEARRLSGLSQRDAAQLLGMSQSQLSKLEGGLKVLPRQELNRHLEQLAEHSRRERFNRLKGTV